MTRQWLDAPSVAEASALRRATAILETSAGRGRLMSQGNFRRLYQRLLADKTRSRPVPKPVGPRELVKNGFDKDEPALVLYCRSVSSDDAVGSSVAAFGERRLASVLGDPVGRVHRNALAGYRAKVLRGTGA